METVTAADVRVSPFDTEELVRLRVAQHKHWVSSEVIFLSSPFADPIEFIHVSDYIALLADEERAIDDALPTIVRVWNRLSTRVPTFPKHNFVVLWYSLFGPEPAYATGNLSREEPFLVEIRDLYQQTEQNDGPFLTLNILQDSTNVYEAAMSKRAKDEIVQLTRDTANAEALLRVEPLETSRVEYVRVNTILSVESEQDPEGLYNNIVCDQLLPMAIFNGSTVDVEGNVLARRELYKMYRGVAFEDTPPFDKEWLKSTPGAISLRLFTGNDLAAANHRDYTLAAYDWEKQQVQISVPVQRGFDQDRAVDTLLEHLPVNVTERRDADIEGTVKVLNFVFRDSLFAEMAMNDPIFRQYLHIRETSLLIVTNRRPTYRMGVPGTENYLEFRIENHESKINEPFLRTNGRELLMEERTPYASLIIAANSNRSIDTFMRIIPYLLARYQEQEASLLAEYRTIIPSYASVNVSSASPSAPLETAIKVLSNIAPEIFTDNYARSCQSGHQPLILKPEEEEAWKAQTFSYRNEQVRRQTMHFPIKGEAQTHIYACPNKQVPFVGLVENTRGNREQFPYLPCCFGDDETNTPGNYYGIYFRDEAPVEPSERTRSSNVIDTNKFAIVGQYGTLPRSINFLLKLGQPGTWYRTGTVLSPNSAIHSLAAIPTFGEEYPLYGETDAREDYVANTLRPMIVGTIFPALLKQELPDIPLAQIQAKLDDPTTFFDPQYYYRVLEEAYQINIVVFTLTPEERLGGLEIPFAKGIVYRPYLNPNRPTIMLYKHSGVEANAGDFPQCELIVHHDPRTGQNDYFARPELVDLLNDALASIARARTWSFDPTQGNLIIDDQANVTLDLASILDVKRMRGQYIDRNGKLRFVLYDDMTIATPFLPPVNVDAIAPTDIQLVELERVFDFVNELRTEGYAASVYALNTDTDGAVVGAWWFLGEATPKTLFFIPTVASPFRSEYEAIHINYLPYPAIFSSGDSIRNHYDHLARVKYILFEVLSYLYIFNLLLPEPMDIETFVQNYTTVREGHVYRTDAIDRYFPQPDTLDEALPLLESKVPTFVQDGRVILDSQAVRERLTAYLEVFNSQVEGRVPELPFTMRNFYQAAADFTQRSGQIIFDNYQRASNWIQRLQQEPLTMIVATHVTDNHTELIDPYVLKGPSGYFLVQNVLDGSYERALNVARNWREGINLGYAAPVGESGIATVYQINESGLLDAPRGSGSDYLLRYPKDNYAALLYLSR